MPMKITKYFAENGTFFYLKDFLSHIICDITDGQISLRGAFEEKRFFESLFSLQKYRV